MIKGLFITIGLITVLLVAAYWILNMLDNGIVIEVPMAINGAQCQLFDCAAKLQELLMPVEELATNPSN